MSVITQPHRPRRPRGCEFCGDFNHTVHHCPDLPPGWHPPRPPKPQRRRPISNLQSPISNFHASATQGQPEPLHHHHD